MVIGAGWWSLGREGPLDVTPSEAGWWSGSVGAGWWSVGQWVGGHWGEVVVIGAWWW